MKKFIIIFLLVSFNSLAREDIKDLADKMEQRFAKENPYSNSFKEIKEKQLKALKAIRDQDLPANMAKALKGLDTSIIREDKKYKAQNKHDLMIFVSSSMPKNLLREYIIEAKQYGGVLVFRGFIGGSLAKTAKFVKALHDKGVSAIIDPRSFKDFNINLVPTILVLDTNSNCKQCTLIHDKVSGSVSVEYALNLISSEGDNAKIADNIIARMRVQ